MMHAVLPALLALAFPLPNRLASEASPYLRQHAHNPVAWYPWGADAFDRAKREGKLVFLSVGYSACHWCHVMERESFADREIATLLNRHFVCVKVDREERPDVDEAYLAAMQALGQGGGWPLSVFLTPAGKPIFGGTYWPPRDKKIGDDTVTGFLTVLNRVVGLAAKDRAGLLKQADKVAELTAAELDRAAPPPAGPLDAALVAAAAEAFEFDPEHGGFGMKANLFRGSKFPRVPALGFLLTQAGGSPGLAKSLRLTLDRVSAGGIRDHLGGGFHRYSTDRTWTVPHFEKMLYDQAQMLELLAAAQGTPAARPAVDRAVAADIHRFVAAELTSATGAFYSALDADSAGEEGAHYVFTSADLVAAVGTGPAATALRARLGLTGPPTFEGKAYVPRLAPDSLPAADPPDVAAARAKLLAWRLTRPRPARDDKVLTGWNGQMIAGYAAAGKAFGEPAYTAAAVRAADFVLRTMRKPDGTLWRVYAGVPGKQPSPRGTAFLDDYAYLTHGLLNLYAATSEDRWLANARTLADIALRDFQDAKRGGFYLTPAGAEALFVRGKDTYDGAQPSPAGVTARNLARLAQLTGDAAYRAAADRAVKAAGDAVVTHPTSCPVTVEALSVLLAPAKP